MQALQERVQGLEGGTALAMEKAEKVEEDAKPDKRQRMVERKGFAKLPEFTGDASGLDVWLFKFKGFMHQEADYRPLLQWIERHASAEEDEEKPRPSTLLTSQMQLAMVGEGAPAASGDTLYPGLSTQIPKALGAITLTDGVPITNWGDKRLEWLGDNLYEVLQAGVTGQHMTYLLRNLEPVTPTAARGCEALFRIIRAMKGDTGPRLMKLVKEIFAPKRVTNLENLGAALEAWENHVQCLELAGQRLSSILKTFGLMQLVPAKMEDEMILLRQQLTNYPKSRAWVLDQAVARTKVKGPEIQGLERPESKEDAAETEEPSFEDLMAFWQKKGGGKA